MVGFSRLASLSLDMVADALAVYWEKVSQSMRGRGKEESVESK